MAACLLVSTRAGAGGGGDAGTSPQPQPLAASRPLPRPALPLTLPILCAVLPLFFPPPRCDVDIRKDLYAGVVLTGGTAGFQALRDRLEKEVADLAPQVGGVAESAPVRAAGRHVLPPLWPSLTYPSQPFHSFVSALFAYCRWPRSRWCAPPTLWSGGTACGSAAPSWPRWAPSSRCTLRCAALCAVLVHSACAACGRGEGRSARGHGGPELGPAYAAAAPTPPDPHTRNLNTHSKHRCGCPRQSIASTEQGSSTKRRREAARATGGAWERLPRGEPQRHRTLAQTTGVGQRLCGPCSLRMPCLPSSPRTVLHGTGQCYCKTSPKLEREGQGAGGCEAHGT